jgi:murein DD-endopeptidase MepM/ murein hydrolase activator NlpD
MAATRVVANVLSVVHVIRGRGLVAALLCCLTVAVAVPADAASNTTTPEQRQRQIDQELDRLHDEIDGLSAEQARLVAELQVSRRARKDLDARVAGIDRDIAAGQRDLDAVTAELNAALASEQAATRALDDAQAQLRRSRAALRDHAIQSYISGSDDPSLAKMLNKLEDVNDGPRVAAYVEVVAARQAAIVDEHKRRQQDLTELQEQLVAAKTAVADRQRQIATRQDELQRARAEQGAARAEVAAEADREQRLLNQVNAQKAAYLARVNQLQRESGQIQADLARRQSGQVAPPASPGTVGWPVANPRVTSHFGYRTHPIFGDRRLHAGIDLAASTGTAVFAAKDGVVVTAGWMSGYGNTVIIDHGNALATLYAHNSALSVSPGQTVKRGQRIASAGSTGNSTGPHVHFEVRVKGSPVDPMSYL